MNRPLTGASALIRGNPSDAGQHTFDAMAQAHHGSPERPPFRAGPAWQARHGGPSGFVAMTARHLAEQAGGDARRMSALLTALTHAAWNEHDARAERDTAQDARDAGL